MSSVHDQLSERQRQCAELIVENSIDRRRDKKVKRLTQEELGQSLDEPVTGRQVRNWLKDPSFLAYIEHLSRLKIAAAMPDFAAVLIQNLEHGQNLSTKQLDLIAKVADWVPQPQSNSVQMNVVDGTQMLEERLKKLEQRKKADVTVIEKKEE